MKKILLIIFFILSISIISCSDNGNDGTGNTCFEQEDYFFDMTPELQWGEKTLDSMELILVQYGTNIKKVSREGEGYTARVVVESDGILSEQPEILLEDFPSEKYGKDKNLYFTIDLVKDNILKNIGYVRVAIEKPNEDGTYTSLLERKGYYAIKGDYIYGEQHIYDVIRYHQEGSEVYQYYDQQLSYSEQIWFDQYEDIVYVCRDCIVEGEPSAEVEQYFYQNDDTGDKYVVLDKEGKETFIIEKVASEIIKVGEKQYKKIEKEN